MPDLFFSHGMKNFLIDYHVVHNLSARDEAALICSYQALHYTFHSASEGFNDHLVGHVTETNGAKVRNLFPVFCLQNQG